MTRLLTCSAAVFAILVGCAAPVDSRQLSPGRSGLAVELVYAPNRQVKEINVTIERVTAHSNTAGWVEVFNQGPVTVDLLTLKTRVMDLGFANLPQGKISQIRLYLKEGGTQNVVLPGGEVEPLKVPSGVQSGIKIKGPFDLASCSVTTVQLDFDGHKSIWYHPTGNGGDWVLRPVIHTRKVSTQGAPCNGTPGTGGGSGAGGGMPGASTGGGSGGTTTGAGGGAAGTGGGTGAGGGGGSDEPFLELPGGACTSNGGCLSGVCQAGVCQPGAQGTPCFAGPNCASGVCGTDGSCTAPVNPLPTTPVGAPCLSGSQCTTGVCSGGVCSPGLQGQPCQQTSDCDTGFVCVADICEPELN